VDARFAPFASDLSTSLALIEDAVRSRREPGVDPSEVVARIQEELRAGRAHAGLFRRDGRTTGLALWAPSGPLGTAVRLVYLEPTVVSKDAYAELFGAITRNAGPVAFASPMPGLTFEEEATVLRSFGFAPFRRSEMRFPSIAPVPSPELPKGVSVRSLRPTDEAEAARVHAAAYRDRFDRYLFLEDLDPVRDAAQVASLLFGGRFGEMLFWASALAEANGRAVGATAVIRSGGRALIADVCVDPAYGGRGVGRALVVATVRALRTRNESAIALAVTEENHRAVRLYEHVGFIRALGPTREWYNTRLIPFPPDAD
jgi:ribosomal protein S18 acetylase RimI-like enzyme